MGTQNQSLLIKEINTYDKRSPNIQHNKLITDNITQQYITKPNPNPNMNPSNLNDPVQSQDYINQIQKVYETSPHLHIEIINSLTLPKNTIINIDPFGITNNNSTRLKRDGFSYFGFTEDLKDNSIDFLIKPKDDQYEEKYLGRHFHIRFNPYDCKYYIKDLGFGFGTFSKIINGIKIKDNYLINLGNTFLVFMFGSEDMVSIEDNSVDNVDKILNVRVFSGNGKSEPMSFHPGVKDVLYIGRDPACDVFIEDNLLSRVHCTLVFGEEYGWVLRDGKNMGINDEGKSSTNGTWIYLMDETEIVDGMIFKGNQNLFECRYEYQS